MDQFSLYNFLYGPDFILQLFIWTDFHYTTFYMDHFLLYNFLYGSVIITQLFLWTSLDYTTFYMDLNGSRLEEGQHGNHLYFPRSHLQIVKRKWKLWETIII